MRGRSGGGEGELAGDESGEEDVEGGEESGPSGLESGSGAIVAQWEGAEGERQVRGAEESGAQYTTTPVASYSLRSAENNTREWASCDALLAVRARVFVRARVV